MSCYHRYLLFKIVAGMLFMLPVSCATRTMVIDYDSPQTRAKLEQAAEVKLNAQKQADKWQLDQAARGFQDLIRLQRDYFGPQHPLVASGLNDLADLYRLWGKYSLAEPLYHAALEIQKNSAGTQNWEIARTMRSQAVLNQSLARYDEARKLFRQSLSTLELESNQEMRSYQYALLLTFIGNLNLELGEYRQAKQNYERALSIQKQLPGNREYEISNTLNNIAIVSLNMGDYREAESTFDEALRLTKNARGEDDPEYAKTLGNMAYLNQLQGKFELSQKRYLRALTSQRQALGENHLDMAKSFNNLAGLLTLTNDYVRAERNYLRSRAIIESTLGTEHQGFALSLNNLGQFYRRIGDYERADRLLEQAYQIMKTALGEKHPQVSFILYNIGILRFNEERYEQAAESLNAARAIQEEAFGTDNVEVALTLYALGKVYRDQGDYDTAESLFEASLLIQRQKLGDTHVRLGYTLNAMGLLYTKKADYAQAESLYQQAVMNAILNEDAELLWRGQHNLSRLLATQNRTGAAVVLGKQAVNTIQKLRAGIKILDARLQDLYVQRKEYVYRSLAGILIELGRILEAEQVIFLLKDFEYRNFMKSIERGGPKDIYEISCRDPESKWCRRFKEISGDIIAMGREYHRLDALTDPDPIQQKRLEELDEDLALARDIFLEYYFEFKNTIENERLEDRIEDLPVEYPERLQTALRETEGGAIWLNYLAGADRLDIIVTGSLPNSQFSRHYNIGNKELRKLVAAFREAIDNQETGQDDMLDLAQTLYNIMIKPVHKDLEQAEPNLLVVSLDDSLNYLPLTALHDEDQFLIEKYSIVIFAPKSEADLAKIPAKIWKAGGLGYSNSANIIDDELGIDDFFSPLKAVEKELKGIILEEDENDSEGILEGKSYLNENFTVDALKKVVKDESKQVVHIATHFEFKLSRVEQSYLVIGGENPLSLDKIYRRLTMPWSKDLLALSACETGLINEPGGGAEIEGLGAMMQRKGARSVLATLWKVDDESTARLMQDFYQLRQEHGGRLKVEALRKAQLNLLNDPDDSLYHLPYYWAPFILMGNWF